MNQLDDQTDRHMMAKLQEIIPQLKRDIETSIRNRMENEMQQALARKRSQITQLYHSKIQQEIEQRNGSIRNSLSELVNKIDKLKREIASNKPRKLTPSQEQDFVQQTVTEITNDPALLQEVTARMEGKLQNKVRENLEQELEEGIENIRREMLQNNSIQRQQWAEERIQYWKEQADRQLEVLATEHNQLTARKQTIEAALTTKRNQRKQAEQRWLAVTEKNSLIAKLKAELKQLKTKDST